LSACQPCGWSYVGFGKKVGMKKKVTGGSRRGGNASSAGRVIFRGVVLAARGMALFLGIYTAISLLASLSGGGYNANAWWIDMSRVTRILALGMQLFLTVALVAFGFASPRRLRYRAGAAVLFSVFAVLALQDALRVFAVNAQGLVRLGFPIPFSLFIMLTFVGLAAAVFAGHRVLPGGGVALDVGAGSDAGSLSDAGCAGLQSAVGTSRVQSAKRMGLSRFVSIFVITLSFVISGILFTLGQIVCFGMTDYRTKVDAIVVFGARSYPSGRLSGALNDRVDKGIELYNQGYTSVLIMSGGIAADGANEALAMQQYAIAQGVPESAIIMDCEGANTELSVANTLRIARENGFKTIGAVSSFYHMPRIKMFFLSSGHDVVTVPATMNREGASSIKTTMREIPAWWYYWFKLAFGFGIS